MSNEKEKEDVFELAYLTGGKEEKEEIEAALPFKWNGVQIGGSNSQAAIRTKMKELGVWNENDYAFGVYMPPVVGCIPRSHTAPGVYAATMYGMPMKLMIYPPEKGSKSTIGSAVLLTESDRLQVSAYEKDVTARIAAYRRG